MLSQSAGFCKRSFFLKLSSVLKLQKMPKKEFKTLGAQSNYSQKTSWFSHGCWRGDIEHVVWVFFFFFFFWVSARAYVSIPSRFWDGTKSVGGKVELRLWARARLLLSVFGGCACLACSPPDGALTRRMGLAAARAGRRACTRRVVWPGTAI